MTSSEPTREYYGCQQCHKNGHLILHATGSSDLNPTLFCETCQMSTRHMAFSYSKWNPRMGKKKPWHYAGPVSWHEPGGRLHSG